MTTHSGLAIFDHAECFLSKASARISQNDCFRTTKEGHKLGRFCEDPGDLFSGTGDAH